MKKKIIIVGGGSAGWMSAAYFHAQGTYDITLIENPNAKPLEMAASTTPYLKRFFKSIGIESEKEWMPACRATYKLGVLYDDWDYPGSRFWNTFEGEENWHCYWNKQRAEEGLPREDFFTSRIYSSHIGINDSGNFLMNKDGKMAYQYHPSRSYGGHPEPWAYHIDTGALNTFLKERTLDSINFVQATIDTINKDKDGITSIVDTDKNIYTADLYIDCSGYSSLLINEVEPDGRIPLEPYLTHDKAVIVEVPYKSDEELKPRTLCKALSAGWMWDVPLYDRKFNGYVYTSEYVSKEDAEKELLDVVGRENISEGTLRHLDIKTTGHYARPWSKNVIALGLSAGFVEPMEATLLMSVQHCLINIDDVFFGSSTKEEFNNKYEATLMDTLDWVSTQYYMSHRQDSDFWRFKSGNKTQIRQRMIDWLKSCEYEMLPPEDDILFYPTCWYAKLVGFGFFPKGDGFPDKETKSLPTYSSSNFKPQNRFKYKKMDELNARRIMDEIRNFDTSVLISQKEYLDRFIYNT